MDAPKSRYRVIERNGRLIVLEAATNLAPKTVRDLRAQLAVPPGVALEPAPKPKEAAEIKERLTQPAEREPETDETDWSHGGEHMPDPPSPFLLGSEEERDIPGAAPNQQAMGVVAGLFAIIVGAIVGGPFGGAILIGGLAYAAWRFWKLDPVDGPSKQPKS